MEHIRRGSLKLDGLRGLVLDEADEMLRMGFAEDVDWILTQAPAQRQIRSSRPPCPIRSGGSLSGMRNPAEIIIKQKAATADTVFQRFVMVGPQHKEEACAQFWKPNQSKRCSSLSIRRAQPSRWLNTYRGGDIGRRRWSSDVSQSQRERIVSASAPASSSDYRHRCGGTRP